MSHKNRATLFSIITPAFLGRFCTLCTSKNRKEHSTINLFNDFSVKVFTVVNFVNYFVEYVFCFHWYKNYKNRPRKARVIIKNKLARFMAYGVCAHCIIEQSVNLIYHLSPTSHHPSLPVSSIPDLKLTCSTNPSHHRSSSYPPDCPLDFNRTPSRTSYHPALCFSSSVIFF